MYEAREFSLEAVEGLSARAIALHLELYRGYVENVNKLLTRTREPPAGTAADHSGFDVRARRMAFEWNGMVLHESFFEELRGPGYRLDDSGVFAEGLDESFGGFDRWRKDILEMAALRGVGWVATVRDRQTNRLLNVWVDEHQLGMPAGVDTVLVVDLWEHAYLMDFAPAKKSSYVETILANIDWSVIEARCVVDAG